MQPFVDEDCFYRLPFDVVQIIFRHIPVHEALQLVLSTSLTPSKHGNNGNTGFVTQLDDTVVKLSKMDDIINMYPNARSLHVQIDECTPGHAYKWTFVKYIQELRLSLSCNFAASTATSSVVATHLATHLATHISQNRSLIKLSLAHMLLHNQATEILCGALCESTVTKVQELNLSANGFGLGGTRAIAALCAVKASLTSLYISNNRLCGVWLKYGKQMGTYTAEGILAIAEALKVTASVTSVSLLRNQFDDETVAMLLQLKEEKSTLTTLCGLKADQTEADFSYWGLTPQDAKLLAPEILVHASVTKMLVCFNKLGDGGATILCNALRESTVTKVQELDLRGNGIGPDGAKAVAAMADVVASLTRVDVSYNLMGECGVKLIRDALRERQGFDLRCEKNEDDFDEWY